jgi:hypothetical protein
MGGDTVGRFAGNPARVVRYCFPKEIIGYLSASKWGEADIKQIQPFFEEF